MPDAIAEAQRLTPEQREAIRQRNRAPFPSGFVNVGWSHSRADALALLADLDATDAALRPFAAMHRAMSEAESHHGRMNDDDPVWAFNDVKLLRGDLRRAAEAGGE